VYTSSPITIAAATMKMARSNENEPGAGPTACGELLLFGVAVVFVAAGFVAFEGFGVCVVPEIVEPFVV
jgi:hypothetical protein